MNQVILGERGSSMSRPRLEELGSRRPSWTASEAKLDSTAVEFLSWRRGLPSALGASWSAGSATWMQDLFLAP